MMVEFKWIQISLFFVTLLQFTAAEQHPPSFTVRVGDEVTLPCENIIGGQQRCDKTSWVYSVFRDTSVLELVKRGQIVERDKSKSDRLSVTENCSLVIKKVTVEDVGRYECQQFKSGQHQGSDSQVLLSVVIISPPAPVTEQNYGSVVTLSCSVTTYERCRLTVKWLYKGREVDKQNQDLRTSQSPCSATVTFTASHYISTSRSNIFTCEVTDGNKVQQFPFSLQSSGEETTTQSTTTATGATGNSMKEGQWWLIVVGLVAVAALLLIIVVAVIRRKRTKRNQRQTDENTGLNSNPAVTPGTSQDTADPEDGVSYASISYTKKTNRKTQARGKDDDDDEAVTYSTVKPSSSSSAGASADPSNLYATIN